MARTKFVAGNWKLNLAIGEGVALVQGLAKALDPRTAAIEIAVCPTALAVHAVAQAAKGTPLKVGAQHVHWDEKGAFTGEISASLAKDAGAAYVLIGHSERRQYYGETDQTVNKRLKAVLAQGLVPIVCVGETLPERDAGRLQEVLRTQLTGATAGLTAQQLASLVIAYEPVWAIGTGRTATTAQAQEAHAFIRSVVRQAYGTLADGVRIQYGGSVKADNARELMSQPDVDGALVGGASLKIADFAAICAAAC
jgi:triosephosphate isomerase